MISSSVYAHAHTHTIVYKLTNTNNANALTHIGTYFSHIYLTTTSLHFLTLSLSLFWSEMVFETLRKERERGEKGSHPSSKKHHHHQKQKHAIEQGSEQAIFFTISFSRLKWERKTRRTNERESECCEHVVSAIFTSVLFSFCKHIRDIASQQNSRPPRCTRSPPLPSFGPIAVSFLLLLHLIGFG